MTKHLLTFLMAFSFTACNSQKDTINSSTALPNVIVVDQPFEMLGLNRQRQIRIYLPKNYNKSKQNYPVLYMHDGQNLFDNTTSYAGEWGVDETLDQLSILFKFDLIVVGIDNGKEKRMNEMSPWENKEFGKAEGEQYMDFIVKQIKPYIDSAYRTLPSRENTAIMGSSMGGLITHFAIYKYPDVFGKAGIFSSSYWFSKEVYDFTLQSPIPKDARLYLMVGDNEGDMVDDSEKMYRTILATGHPKQNLTLLIDPEGEHGETTWRRQFGPAIMWLFRE